MTDVPHFSLPFRYDRLSDGRQRVAVTEQDTAQEIGDCVELILRTVQGDRATLPDFGRPEELEFTLDRELARSLVQQAVDEFEPRARTLVENADDETTDDEGILRLRVLYDIGGESE